MFENTFLLEQSCRVLRHIQTKQAYEIEFSINRFLQKK